MMSAAQPHRGTLRDGDGPQVRAHGTSMWRRSGICWITSPLLQRGSTAGLPGPGTTRRPMPSWIPWPRPGERRGCLDSSIAAGRVDRRRPRGARIPRSASRHAAPRHGSRQGARGTGAPAPDRTGRRWAWCRSTSGSGWSSTCPRRSRRSSLGSWGSLHSARPSESDEALRELEQAEPSSVERSWSCTFASRSPPCSAWTRSGWGPASRWGV